MATAPTGRAIQLTRCRDVENYSESGVNENRPILKCRLAAGDVFFFQ